MIAVLTTFGNDHYHVYGKRMIESFVKNWPREIPLLVQLDDGTYEAEVQKILREQDAVAVGWSKEHAEFVTKNKHKDSPNNYRKQATRFCHKVFALDRALTAVKDATAAGVNSIRYLVWLDADVITDKTVTMEDIKSCLPKEGDAVSYLGRKDWPHSECGFMAFDLENRGEWLIESVVAEYTSGRIFEQDEWHDSWIFDCERPEKSTNLTEGKPGMDIWQHSPLAKFSTHYKGPVAKNNMVKPSNSNIVIQTKNAIPNEQIQSHIRENQKLIKEWIRKCNETDEQIVVVSAGPQLYAEDVIKDYESGKKIIAVKHALQPLREAGIVPWGTILLDPRPHVYDFVDKPDTEIIYFVASQVNPRVTERLLAFGCKVIGYHAAVGAGEGFLTEKQPDSIIGGGSATATRGLFVLKHLGFYKIKLFGYDLCFPDKPDLNALDDLNQPKFLEMSVGWNDPLSNMKKCFWTEPQLVAQFEEFNDLISKNEFEFEAHGDGLVPFIMKAKKAGELRRARLNANIKYKPSSYGKLLKWKKTNLLTRLSSKISALATKVF